MKTTYFGTKSNAGSDSLRLDFERFDDIKSLDVPSKVPKHEKCIFPT
jgi:hypothetical protein